jgi:AMMECR1 domain-containing protein
MMPMLEIVQQTIDFYTKYLKTPDIKELKIENPSLLNQKGSIFVTLYKNGEIR